MKYKYRTKENASQLLYAKDLPGLPEDITLSFNNVHIRFYKSREMGGFFFCTLAIPTIKDDEGYVFESDFYNCKVSKGDLIKSQTYSGRDHGQEEDASESEDHVDWEEEENIDFSTYIVPYNDTSIEELPKAVSCYFEAKTERRRRLLFLNMKINGTSFRGEVFIDSDYYTEK
jgi:hypothetical protein